MAKALEAIVEAEPVQQRAEAGCSRLSDAKWPPRRTVDQQHVGDTGTLEGKREG
jgi:hypothetical protein